MKSHKIVLASQTKYFEGLFRQEDQDSVQLHFPGDSIRTCVQFLYTGQVQVTGENVQDLLMAANYLFINKLVSLCTAFILKNIELSNCIEILKLGDMTSNNELEDKALLMICNNIQEILKTEDTLKSIPLHLFKKVLQNKNLLLRFQFNSPLKIKEIFTQF